MSWCRNFMRQVGLLKIRKNSFVSNLTHEAKEVFILKVESLIDVFGLSTGKIYEVLYEYETV